ARGARGRDLRRPAAGHAGACVGGDVLSARRALAPGGARARGAHHRRRARASVMGRPAGILCLVAVLALGGCGERTVCEAPPGEASAAASRALRRDEETRVAMAVLGLHADPDPAKSEVLFLGYPNLALERI